MHGFRSLQLRRQRSDIDDSCEYAAEYYDCDGNCLNDADGDGVCDELEIDGCSDSEACNYDASATELDDSCEYAADVYDCDGICERRRRRWVSTTNSELKDARIPGNIYANATELDDSYEGS